MVKVHTPRFRVLIPKTILSDFKNCLSSSVSRTTLTVLDGSGISRRRPFKAST